MNDLTIVNNTSLQNENNEDINKLMLDAVNKELGNNVVDYGPYTSNGNEGIQLAQSVGGSRYQQHYLKFHTFSNASDDGFGRFNPSMYSNKYHVSKVKITHPNDGDVGYLDDVLAVHPKNIYQNDPIEAEAIVNSELIGFGDGVRKVFYLQHAPLTMNAAQPLVIKSSCEIVTNYTYDADTKAIRFDVAPLPGKELLADYEYSHAYRYNLPTAPQSAFTLAKFSPYAPIGLAVLTNPNKPKTAQS